MSYYAVLNGFVPGIYTSWQDCRPEVTGYSRAFFRKFYRYSDAYDFLYDNRIIVYVDGSAINNGYANARAGYGVWFQNPDLRYLNQQCRLSGDIQSNNRAELTAIIIALEIAPEDGRKLIICSDSNQVFTILGLNARLRSRIGQELSTKDSIPDVLQNDFSTRTLSSRADGSCFRNGRSDARAGYGIYFENPELKSRYGRLPGSSQTSNRGELFAILNACQLARKDQRQLVVFTDCRYALKPVLERMPLWQSKGWRNNKGKKVGDQDLVMQLYHELISLKPELHWVRGHSGIMGNEVADHLAKQGADLDPKISARGSEEITQAALLPELHDLFRQLTISAKRA
ncbi:hypothetical protein NDA14_007635 [Ustilago hordei]|nr:hypothetical protein NDA10_004974 [Ustilago hordei]KAJ1594653.1 hypothetical protein NDA14_007635 [Ustilago hordei]